MDTAMIIDKFLDTGGGKIMREESDAPLAVILIFYALCIVAGVVLWIKETAARLGRKLRRRKDAGE
jgi:hypothetical protein